MRADPNSQTAVQERDSAEKSLFQFVEHKSMIMALKERNGSGQDLQMSPKDSTSIARLESQRTSLLLNEQRLRSIARKPSVALQTKASARREPESCQKRLAELTRQIAYLEERSRS